MPRILYTDIPAEPPDYRRIDVITPHPAAARAVGAPHRSLLALARSIVNARGFQVARPLLARRLLVTAVARVRENTGETRSQFEALATRLSPMLKTALRTGVDTARLREFGSLRAIELAAVVDIYRELLRGQQTIDSEELLLFATSLEPDPRPLYLHGYFRARPQEIAFVNAVCGEGSVLVLPINDAPIFEVNRNALEIFRAAGWSEERPQRIGDGIGAVAARQFCGAAPEPVALTGATYPDVDAEVRAALGQIKTLLAKGTSPSSVALVAREPARYGAALTAVANDYGVPFRRTDQVALTETRVGGWLALLLEAVRNDLAFEPTVRLVAHPLGAGLAAVDWRQARAAHPHGIEAWSKLSAGLDLLNWPARDTRRNWLQRLRDLLYAANLRARCGGSARDLAAVDLLEAELSVDFHGQETLHRGELTDEITTMLAELEVVADPGSGGVELYEPQSIIGARFDHLFILGVTDGVLPQQPADNPVIDFYERRELRTHGVEFESAAEIARWEDLAFNFLLETAGTSISFSHPQVADQKPRLPSSYFARMGLKPAPAANANRAFSVTEWRRYAVGNDPQDDPVASAARRAQRIEFARESSAAYDEFDGVTGIGLDVTNRTWSASQLLRLGQCPFHWFADKALRLAVPDEPSVGLAPDVRGRLYHKVLELVLADLPSDADPREWALSRLEEAFDAAEASPEVALPLLPAWPAQRLEYFERLRRAILSEDFIAPDTRVIGREAVFRGNWHGLKVYGVIDRVDQTPDGLVFVDYKTGRKPNGIKDEAGNLTVDIQLPIYLEAAAPVLYPGRPVAGGNYFSITRAEILDEVGSEPVTELAQFADSVRTRLAQGNFPVEPDPQQNACTFCDYTAVCRRGHRLTRKSVSPDR